MKTLKWITLSLLSLVLIVFFQNCSQLSSSGGSSSSLTSNSIEKCESGLPSADIDYFANYDKADLDLQASTSLSSPRFEISQLSYQGAFRMPLGANDEGNLGSSTNNYSLAKIAYNSNHHSIYIEGKPGSLSIGEFQIPSIVKSTDVSDLNYSTLLQSFTPVLNKASIDAGLGLSVSGMFYYNNKLLINVFRFYDQNPSFPGITLVANNANNLSTSSVNGYLPMDGGRLAAGWISPIPSGLQSILGSGTHMTGFSGSTARATVFSSRGGPSAYSFNPMNVIDTNATNVATTELMHFLIDRDYNQGVSDMGQVPMYNPDRTNKLWTFSSEASFGMIIPGTRTYMVLGGSGGHESGIGYGDPPYGGDKGYYSLCPGDNHPYYWLFDVNDFDKVRKGQILPYQILPYEAGILQVPFQEEGRLNGEPFNRAHPVTGGSYDPTNGTLYLSLFQADGAAPLILAYKFKVK